MINNPPATAGDMGSISGSAKFPEEGNGNSLQYPFLEIPWTEKSGGLQSMGSQRVGHDWTTNTATSALEYLFNADPWQGDQTP